MEFRTATGERPISLADIDPGATGGMNEVEADRRLATLQAELRGLHDLIMAAETHALLVILQGMDASGKDVTIENVHAAFNPQAARVKAFKARVGDETKRHFLWRADHRWHHNVAVAQLLVDRLQPYREDWERTRREVGEANQQEAEAARRGDEE